MAFSKINRLISRTKDKEDDSATVSLAAASMPKDHIAYVVGDIHGRNDLLLPLLERIERDAAIRNSAKTDLIFLGDYVDRGSMSKAVIDTILDLDLPKMNIVTLNGNHETSMLAFMADPLRHRRWLHYGGEATLRSYGVEFSFGEIDSEKIKEVATQLDKAVPTRHKAFLSSLVDSYSAGDYFFAHAGVDPKQPLKDQKLKDLLWIREEFLDCTDMFEKVIIHGHSITTSPEFKENRIGIDTGAFYSNTLTCLVLDGETKEIL